MIYHKAMVFMELFHMIIMIQAGALRYCTMENNWALKFWIDQSGYGWCFGNWFKLAISTLAAFLSLERFIAVCLPIFFDRTNQKPVAHGAICLSLCIGSAHVWQVFTAQVIYDQTTKQYVSILTPFANSLWYNFSVNVIYSAKIGLSLFIFSLSVATAIGMKMKSKKIEAMSNNSARKDWKSKRSACILAYALGVTTLVDHIVWVAFKYYKENAVYVTGANAIVKLNFDQALVHLHGIKSFFIVELVQRLLGQIVHSWRFFIYLATNPAMRNAFKKLFFRNNAVNVAP